MDLEAGVPDGRGAGRRQRAAVYLAVCGAGNSDATAVARGRRISAGEELSGGKRLELRGGRYLFIGVRGTFWRIMAELERELPRPQEKEAMAGGTVDVRHGILFCVVMSRHEIAGD